MIEKNLIMVTTLQDDLYIYNLLKSLDNNLRNITLEVIVVCQDIEVVFSPQNELLTLTLLKESRMSLSKARNKALTFLYKRGHGSEYIMFPDDDSSFDAVFFDNFGNILGTKKNYIGYIYNEGSKELYLGKKTEENKLLSIKDYDLVGSPNQIIQYKILNIKFFFNELLGVGAKYGSSEDFDFFVNITISGFSYYFKEGLYSYHPSKKDNYTNLNLTSILERFKNYSSGFAYVLFKHKLYHLLFNYLIRTLLASAYYFLQFNFKLSFAYLIQFYYRIRLIFNFMFNYRP
jgi:hypothetical protein